jgi:chaperonin GroES
MATVQLSGAIVGAAAFAGKGLSSLDALRLPSTGAVVGVRPARRAFRSLVVRASSVVAPKVRHGAM